MPTRLHASMPPCSHAPPPPCPLAAMLVLLSLLPLTTLFSLVILRFSFVPAGIIPGLGQTALVIFLALLPFCLGSGILFPILVQSLSALKGKNLLHEGYALDSAGSIAGGLLFSLVFIFVLPPYESLIVLTLICLVILSLLAVFSKKVVLVISTIIIGTSAFFLLVKFEPGKYLHNRQFNRQKVIEIKSSPYGMLAVTTKDDQLFIYENGIPLSSEDDAVQKEEAVHYAMLLHHMPDEVLMISGGATGMLNELLKYPISRMDYIEPNPWLIRLVESYRPFPNDKRINKIFRDPRTHLAKSDEKYDVILINTPVPNSAELNRFYTIEFYRLLKTKLNPGGIISVAVPAAGNYMSETSRQVHSVSYNTLEKVFSHIRIIPGNKDYLLASDSALDHSFLNKYLELDFTNTYVNPLYISEDLQKMRSDLIMKDLLPDEPVNTDLRPYVFSLFLRQWLERFNLNNWVIPLFLMLSLIGSLIFLGPLNLGLFTCGFTASALEFLLLIWFQVMYGYVYQMTGVIFAVFMSGIVAGSLYRQKLYKNNTFAGFLTIQGALAAFSALMAVLILIIPTGTVRQWIIVLIMLLVLITGLLTGVQFSLSAYLRKTDILKSSGESFSADLLGSAIGIVLVSVYLVPQLGLPMTGLLLAGLNAVVIKIMPLKK